VAAVNATGEESAASDVQVVTAGLSCQLKVRVDWLPEGATGWLVYAGAAEGVAGLQSLSPLPPGAEFVLGAVPAAGRPPVEGQAPREWVLRSRRLG